MAPSRAPKLNGVRSTRSAPIALNNDVVRRAILVLVLEGERELIHAVWLIITEQHGARTVRARVVLQRVYKHGRLVKGHTLRIPLACRCLFFESVGEHVGVLSPTRL